MLRRRGAVSQAKVRSTTQRRSNWMPVGMGRLGLRGHQTGVPALTTSTVQPRAAGSRPRLLPLEPASTQSVAQPRKQHGQPGQHQRHGVAGPLMLAGMDDDREQ